MLTFSLDMMKIAFDFDGVCTDLSRIQNAGIDLHQYLYSPVAILFAEPRQGVLQLLSLFGLVGEIVILSARPVVHRCEVVKWLERFGMRHLVEDIICCGDEAKVEAMAREGISLLIEDDFAQASAARERSSAVYWERQGWSNVAMEAFGYLLANHGIPIKSARGAVLTGVELATDLGESHVFLLHIEEAGDLKVRVCRTERDRDRLLGFLNTTERHGYCNITQLRAVNGNAVMTTFVPGVRIGETFGEERSTHLASTAAALAALHAIPAARTGNSIALSMHDEPVCLLSCSADNHNIIITSSGEVAFIDLGACTLGSRWIDLCWADELLCRNDQERSLLWARYLAASQLAPPSAEEMDFAQRSYRVWLTEQLIRGVEVHAGDPGKYAAIVGSIADLWSVSGGSGG